ncbi:hypothetical protein HOY82DRAFT_537716 [Tuber indicum]|nr:hypothetical protein HOY82DRAFT_537716 [Tuber indicum]
MPVISPFLAKPFLPQFNKRDHTQNEGGDDSDAKSPVVVVVLVIAAMTLLVAMVPLFRCQRFHAWMSSFSIPSSVKDPAQKALGIVTLPNPSSATTTAKGDLSPTPIAGMPIPGPAPVHNDYSNIRPASSHSITSPYRNNVITGGDGRVRQVEEFLGPRRPDPVATRGLVPR